MLVGDEDGVEGGGVFVGDGHALEEFAAGEAGVDEEAGVSGGDDRRVALGAGGENGHAHRFQDTPNGCGLWGRMYLCRSQLLPCQWGSKPSGMEQPRW